jgi:hypothetical protein
MDAASSSTDVRDVEHSEFLVALLGGPSPARQQPTLLALALFQQPYTLLIAHQEQARRLQIFFSGVLRPERKKNPVDSRVYGTVHSYSGLTLRGPIIDCRNWQKKPVRDDTAFESYIAFSRVRSIEKVFLVQAYNPWLFRQGEVPGPHLLMDFWLHGKKQDTSGRGEGMCISAELMTSWTRRGGTRASLL